MIKQTLGYKEKKGEWFTNQEANCAANLFAIYLSHFHAVPKNKKQQSELRTSFLGANTVFSFKRAGESTVRDQRQFASCH